MASRKEQKEQARAARLAQEQERAARAQRTQRLQILGGVVAIAVIAVVVIIVVANHGAKSPANTPTGLQKATQASKTYSAVNSLIGGIHQSGTVLGNPNAKVTMTYFGDLECPICKAFTLYVLPQFIREQVRTNNVKIDYRSDCTATCNNQSWGSAQAALNMFGRQQVAAYAAGMQNKFWDFAELFYHEQGEEDTGYMNDSYLAGLAKQIPGLNLNKWNTDRSDPTLLSQVSADIQAAQKDAPNGTPTLIMSGPKGEEPVSGDCTVGGVPEGFPCYSGLAAAVKTVS